MSAGPSPQPQNKIEIELVVPRSSKEGQSVTFSATVESAPDAPTGVVIFRDNGVNIGQAQLQSGTASLTVSNLELGEHSIAASYAGDSSETKTHEVKLTFADLEHKWSRIQSQATVAALFIAAVWAVITWIAQRNVRIENEEPSLEMRVCAWQDEKLEKVIRGIVTIKNVGNKRETIYLNDGPLFVARVRFPLPTGAMPASKPGEDGKISNGQVEFEDSKKFLLSQPSVDDPSRWEVPPHDEIHPQATDEYQFLVRVDAKGTYAIMFSAKPSDEEQHRVQEEHPDVKGAKGLKYNWRWEPPPVFVDVKDGAGSGLLPPCATSPSHTSSSPATLPAN